MSNFVYPTSVEIREIGRVKEPVLTMDDPIFSIMPIREDDNFLVMWEQKDNYDGLQQLRGLDGQPARVQGVGSKRFQYQPGVYGEYAPITEEELTVRRQIGTFGAPIDISSLVMDRQDQLLNRRIDRIRKIGWDVLQGNFTVSGSGGLVHADAFPVQVYTAGVAWSSTGTATPLKDFRAVQLFEEGRSCSFGEKATAYMNRRTFNNLVANTNINDIAGRRTSGLQTVLTLDEINKVLLGEGLPQIKVYHEGYYTKDASTGVSTWNLFIPTNKVIVVGARSNGTIAEYLMVRNATNPNMEPGAYTRVVDDPDEIPRTIEVHDGHNGGPVIYFPGDIVNMNV